MQLSRRLQAVANLVTKGKRLADIGTDHGYVPIYLYQLGRIPSGIAMDINKGPLERAISNIDVQGLSAYITTRLSDGLQSLEPMEAQSVVIAGMGGALMIKILSQGAPVLATVEELILQPQSELDQVRLFLYSNGYIIVEENMIFEDGKYYPMMRVAHGKGKKLSKEEIAYGPILLQNKNKVLKEYLEKELKVYGELLQRLKGNHSEGARIRIEEIKEEMQSIDTALSYYEM